MKVARKQSLISAQFFPNYIFESPQMKIPKLIVVFLISILSLSTFSQEKTSRFGIKGGLNFSKYSPDKNSMDYQFKPGFYAGGFVRFKFDKGLSIQPELLFSLQGSKVDVQNIVITDFAGNPMPFTSTFDFKYEVHELTLSLPIIGKLYFTDNFYLLSGPQFNFILDRNITSSQTLLSGTNDDFIMRDGDSFEFAVCVGFGYDISDSVTITTHSYVGLNKRDDDIKSVVLNFGLEYRFK